MLQYEERRKKRTGNLWISVDELNSLSSGRCEQESDYDLAEPVNPVSDPISEKGREPTVMTKKLSAVHPLMNQRWYG